MYVMMYVKYVKMYVMMYVKMYILYRCSGGRGRTAASGTRRHAHVPPRTGIDPEVLRWARENGCSLRVKKRDEMGDACVRRRGRALEALKWARESAREVVRSSARVPRDVRILVAWMRGCIEG